MHANDRFRFLSEISQLLSESLDYEKTLANVTAFAVPHFADACGVYIVEENGTIRRIARSISDRQKQEFIAALEARQPAASDIPLGPPKVIRTGEPDFAPDFRALIAPLIQTDEHREIVRQLAFKSYICVPLRTKSGILGAMTFATYESNREYETEDLKLAEELAGRAAIAIEHARLYKSATDSEQRMSLLLRCSSVLFASLDLESALIALARLLASEIGDYCIVYSRISEQRVSRVAVAHRHPEKEKLLQALHGQDLAGPVGETLTRVMTSGKPRLVEEISTETLANLSGDPRYVAIMQEISPRSAMIVPLVCGERVLGALCVSITSSDHRYNKSDLAHLEEIGRRAAQAIEHVLLYREAQEASQMKDEFLATLSHELRTPLTAMVGWSRLLMDGRVPAERLQPAYEAIYRNAQAQAELIEELLDLSRIAHGKLQLDAASVDAKSALQATIELIRPMAESRKIQLTLDCNESVPPVRADAGRLQQILWNLLTNAVKFTPRGGSVLASLRWKDDAVEIAIKDTGVGISADFLPYAFDRFRQADGTNARSKGGLGLGLSIVKHLVDLHGGTVTAESAGQDQGSVFTVCLPLFGAAIRSQPSPTS